MKTAIIYTRVSSEDQVSGTSLDSQLMDCLRYAESKGYVVAKTFTDAGLSAKTTQRPALQKAIAYAANKRPDALIVWKLDRLSRKTSDGLLIRAALKKVGCELLSATEAVTSDPTGDLVSTLLLGVAEFDNAQRAIRCRRGMEEVTKKGGWCHKAPEGFCLAKAPDGLPILKHDPIKGPAMASILGAYARGAISKSEYYTRMAAIGLNAKKAEKITRAHVYGGLIVSVFTNGEPIQAAFPGLISPAEFWAIQKRKTSYKPRAQLTVSDERIIWKGLVRCEACGRPLTIYCVKGQNYYKCPKCRGYNVRDKIINEEARKLLSRAKDLAALLSLCVEVAREKAAETLEASRAETIAAEKRISDAKQKRRRLVDAYLEGKIPEEVYREKLVELSTIIQSSNLTENAEQDAINAALNTVEKAVQTLENPGLLLTSLPPESVHQILALTLGHLTLRKNKTLTVSSNQPTQTLHTLLNPIKSTSNNKKGAENRATSPNLPLWWTIGGEVIELCGAVVEAAGYVVGV